MVLYMCVCVLIWKAVISSTLDVSIDELSAMTFKSCPESCPLVVLSWCVSDTVVPVLPERHMQRIGHLLQASMFLDYMWQKMRLTGGTVR